MPELARVTVVAALCAILAACGSNGGPTPPDPPNQWPDSITVRNPVTLPSSLHALRVPVGVEDDYKPAMVALANGTILLAMFHPTTNSNGTYQEDTVLYRSTDGGQTWGTRESFPGLGREAYFTLLSDGTLLVTASVLSTDYRNTAGYTYAVLYRSSDGGATWTNTNIQTADAPGGTPVVSSRNVLELADGTLLLGVGAGTNSEYLWRSNDKGLTWDKTLVPQDPTGAFNEAANGIPWTEELVLSQARNGDLVGIARVYCTAVPGNAPVGCAANDLETIDVAIRSQDGGQTWALDPPLGMPYGEMYASILPLTGDRPLLTYTVRSLQVPLGVQAVLGTESDTGYAYTFTSDVMLLDTGTPASEPSGGGFGNTVKAPDGSLVTSYSYRASDGHTDVETIRWRLP